MCNKNKKLDNTEKTSNSRNIRRYKPEIIKSEEGKEINQNIKDLVLMRLETMPKTIKIVLGFDKELNREDLINHVKKEDKLGKLIIEMQLKYLRSLKTNA